MAKLKSKIPFEIQFWEIPFAICLLPFEMFSVSVEPVHHPTKNPRTPKPGVRATLYPNADALTT